MAKKKPASKKKHRPPRKTPLQGGAIKDLPLLQQARALWQRDRLVEALTLFERAVREHPDHPIAVIDASRAFAAAYRVERAEQLLSDLTDRAKGSAGLLQLIGQSYRLLRRPEAARRRLVAAAEADGRLADAWLELAILDERSGQLEDAREAIERRLKLLPGDPEALVISGRLLRRNDDHSASQALLRRVAESPKAHWITRSRAYSELAQSLDAEGDYDAAWSACVAGKKLAAPHAAGAKRHRQKQLKVLEAITGQLTNEQVSSWSEDAEHEPTALLTGLPRSGTTLLAHVLGGHPDIVACDEFDAFPRFLIPFMLGPLPIADLDADRLTRLPRERIAKLRPVYRRFMSEALGTPFGGKLLVDKNPSLLPVIPLYRRLLPGSRVVVCVRDPRDVLVSCMLTHLPLNDFSVDLLAVHSAIERIALDLDLWRQMREKLNGGWVEVRYEDLVADLQEAVTPALEACDLAWDEGILAYREASGGRAVNSPTYAEVAKPIHDRAIGRWRNYRAQLEPILSKCDAVAESLGY